jgi:hypothetical protein
MANDSSDDKKIIFSMVGVSKKVPSGKQILKDIYLSFFLWCQNWYHRIKWQWKIILA